MQKIIITAAIASAAIFAASPAAAIDNVYRPYIGAAYAYDTARADGYHSYYNSGALIVGSTYNPYFSTEVFYQHSDKAKYNSRHNLKSSYFQAYGLDMLGYLPLGCEGTIAPVATMGIGEYTLKNDYRFGKDRRDHGWGYRFGGGLRYNLAADWSAVALVRYVKLDGIKDHDHLTEYSLAVKYVF